jgi:shikimate dehydrogenase
VSDQYLLLGDPVAHSLSPFIMNAALGNEGLPGHYGKRKVIAGGLAKALSSIRQGAASGANITTPLKNEVLRWVDAITPEARIIGAANVIEKRQGQLIAHNTDCTGLVQALEVMGGYPVQGKRAVILGAGGAGRAAAFGLLKAGCLGLTILVRDRNKGSAQCGALVDNFGAERLRVENLDAPHARNIVHRADLLINATPVGMADARTSPLPDGDWVKAEHLCLDLIYHPPQTAFLRAAQKAGAQTMNGLPLLVAQAQGAFRIWTGRNFELDAMMGALSSHLQRGK